ncbi:MAG: hypothetical protein SGILL_000573 [Bacillariaceae sp.]
MLTCRSLSLVLGFLAFISTSVIDTISAYSLQQQQPSKSVSPSTPSSTQLSKQQKQSIQRRVFFTKALVSTSAVLTSKALFNTKPADAVISSKYCAYGEGDGCSDLAEGNSYILELQKKSSANKETIQQEAKNAFYMKNYPDWFAAVGKSMVKNPDGSFMVVSDAELAELKAQNKIGIEYATAMGGKVSDVTQKPIMVLKE